MKRGNFLKSLFTLIASPSLLAGEKDIPDAPVKHENLSATLFIQQGEKYKPYVSAIDFLDQRDIDPDIWKADDTTFSDVMDSIHAKHYKIKP